MSDLGDILDHLKELSTSEDCIPLQKEKVFSILDPRCQPPKEMPTFTDADRVPRYTLVLSEEEIFWLAWRLSVHLWSYQYYPWPEMKEQLTKIVKRIEEVKHGSNQGL